MAPRWFSNIRFGEDASNAPHQDVIQQYKDKISRVLQDVTFNSTGPIIEEVPSEPGSPQYEPQHQETCITLGGCQTPTVNQSVSPQISNQSQTIREPSHQSQESAQGLRRSTRNRHKPLDYKRGQRIIYNIKGDILGVEEGFPEKYDYSRKITKTRRASGKVKCPPDAKPADLLSWKTASKGNYDFNCKKVDNLITGVLKLKAKQSKPEARTDRSQKYIFMVKSGSVIIKISDSVKVRKYFMDPDSDWFQLPRGYRYSIKNMATGTSTVAYIVSD